EAQLCQVGCYNICPCCKLLHHSEELRSTHAESPPVIPHDRICEQKRLLSIESVQKIKHLLYLPSIRHESCIDPVERHSHLLPLPAEFIHFICIIIIEITRVSGLSAQNRRRKRTGLYSHRCNDRDRRRKRTSPEARQIIDDRYLFRHLSSTSLSSPVFKSFSSVFSLNIKRGGHPVSAPNLSPQLISAGTFTGLSTIAECRPMFRTISPSFTIYSS